MTILFRTLFEYYLNIIIVADVDVNFDADFDVELDADVDADFDVVLIASF